MALLPFSLQAENCQNFQGKWSGTCSDDALIQIHIKQDSCELITYQGKKITMGKGFISETRNISGKQIEEKRMASWSSKGKRIFFNSITTITIPPKTFHTDVKKISLTMEDNDTLIYALLGKKVQALENKIAHVDYSKSCFLTRDK
jgi:hypothetical protein